MMDDELKEKFIEFIKDGKCPCRLKKMIVYIVRLSGVN
jgi:hypothetical protein